MHVLPVGDWRIKGYQLLGHGTAKSDKLMATTRGPVLVMRTQGSVLLDRLNRTVFPTQFKSPP